MAEIKEQSSAADEVSGVGDVFWWLDIDLGLRFLGPAFIVDHALLQFADAGEVFIELVAVFAAEIGAQRLCLSTDIIENAAPIFESLELVLNIVRLAFKEQAGENSGRRIVSGNQSPCAGPRQAARAFTRQSETGKTCLRADVISGELIERDRIAKARSPGTRRSREEAG